MNSLNRFGAGLVVAGVAWVWSVPGSAQPAPADLTDLPLEELMKIPLVVGVSRYEQKATEAPASVTVVTAAEIRRFGYRTLAEVLQGVRGTYATNDRNYSYIGIRGFQRPGDYNTRVLMLVDGHRINEAVYSAAYVGTEQLLDLENIERVEIIRGPSSSVYGTGAFLGVVNIVTRHVPESPETWIAAGGSSFSTGQARAGHTRHFPGGGDLLVSGSWLDSGGQDLFYPEFDDPATNNGRVDHDADRYGRFYARWRRGRFTLSAAHATRTKDYPTASFGTIFNDPRARTMDERSYADLAYERDFERGEHLLLRVAADRYWYRGRYPYDYPPPTVYTDPATGYWLTVEGQVRTRACGRHRLTLGTETRFNLQQDLVGHDEEPYALYTEERHDSVDAGFYVEDEIRAGARLRIQAGLRYDHHELFGDSLNPRLGIIRTLGERAAVKFLYGTAFRAPNVYELFYNDGGASFKASGGLDPETIDTYEVTFDHQPTPNVRVAASAYQYEIEDLISLTTDPGDGLLVFRNLERVRGRGLEVEVERRWAEGHRLRFSHAYQGTRDLGAGMSLSNSPRHLSKLHAGFSLLRDRLETGFELLSMSGRRTPKDTREPGRTLANLTVTGFLPAGLTLSAGVLNLLDEEYGDPGSEEHVQDVIPQDGRSFRATVTKKF
ncbi:MAG: TonB-dependent receptor plug domain-containing protein [Candidatus Polarisedimenticolia bacterium]